MEITFKNAAANDIDKVFQLNKKLIEDYETNLNLDFEKVFDWDKKKVEKNIDKYQCIYFKGIKVGYFYLHNEGWKLELDDFFIFDQFQGRGIGTKVLKYIDVIFLRRKRTEIV